MIMLSRYPLTIKEIWVTSFKLYPKVFPKVWYFGMIINIITAMMIIIFVNVAHAAESVVFRTLVVLIPLTVIFLTVYISSLILYQIYNKLNEQSMSFQAIIAIVHKKYLKIIGGMLSVFILYFLGTALVLPGIFMLILFVAVQPLILFDDKGIIEAFKDSSKLVWGSWWRTFSIIFPFLLLNYWIESGISNAFIQHSWYLIGFSILLQTLFYPLFYICILIIFNDLKIRKSSHNITIATAV